MMLGINAHTGRQPAHRTEGVDD